ncbi:MAG TPA: hypothetical protein VJZ00_21730 [Thermoanaerobaculia bacterium]|nr:hypothetical protein [Thermoanaerobaculia bacterium]
MSEITVVLSGIVLLVSSNAYLTTGGSNAISSAIAVEARTPIDSAYDIDIPVHNAMLTFLKADVDGGATIDPDKRLEPAKEGDSHEGVDLIVLQLRGDRVQLGTGGAVCGGLPASTTNARDSLQTLPRLSEIVRPDVTLRSGTFPVGTNFTGMDKSRVAAWLDIRGGHLRATHTEDERPRYEEVEFRPTRRRARISPHVLWTAPAGVDCVVVTPFAAGGKMIKIVLNPDRDIRIGFHNMADMSTGELVPGIAYDFELFYRLINNSPVIPPLPYTLAEIEIETGGPGPDGLTGVNCGPPRVR